VPSKYSHKGIGKALVAAAEARLVSEVRKTILASKYEHEIQSSIIMEMNVLNLRTGLFPWYESQGYKVIHEIKPNDPAFDEIVLDGFDAFLVLMRKIL